MNNTIKGILLGLVLTLSLIIGWLSYVKIPRLEQELDAWENAEPEVIIELVEGPVDTVVVYEKEIVHVPVIADTEVVEEDDSRRTYRTSFGDSVLQGSVLAEVEGILIDTEVSYWFKRDIIQTRQVNTERITLTRNVVRKVPTAPKGLEIGVFAGATSTGDLILGPSVGLLLGDSGTIGYSYDPINKGHYVTYRTRIKFPSLSIF